VTSVAVTAPIPGSPGTFIKRGRSIGWWGVLCTIATEAMLFAGLLSSYFFLWASSPHWPQGGIEPPELGRITFFTLILLGSSIPVFYAEWANKRGHIKLALQAMALAFVMGASFIVNQLLEYHNLGFGFRDNAYTAIFYLTTGLHGLHVLLGLMINLVVQAKGRARRLAPRDDISIEVFSLYWHFVDAVWIFVFASLYIAPHFAR
jgi:cytochrome c oxidase subunit 3